MQISYNLNKVIRATFVLLTVLIVTAALGGSLPVTAKADDTWLLPETLSAGDFHTCAIQSDGTLACWGRDDNDRLLYPGQCGILSHLRPAE